MKLAARIHLGTVMGLPERAFSAFVTDVEQSPAFKHLVSFRHNSQKLLTWRRFSGTSLACSFAGLNENLNHDKSGFDIETLLHSRPGIIELILSIGRENFEKWFLYDEEARTPEEVAALCDVPLETVEKINEFVNEIDIYDQFHASSKLVASGAGNYYKIAAIEHDGAGGFDIRFYSPRFARGKYIIHYDLINELKKQGCFTGGEWKNIGRLINKLELINSRKTTMYRIIYALINKQREYFLSGDEKRLAAFTQRELARDIGVDASLVCRGICSRSIETPQHVEKPLHFFLPSLKDIRKNILRELMAHEERPLSDSEIRNILKQRFHSDISRRSIACCRAELGIESSQKRKTR